MACLYRFTLSPQDGFTTSQGHRQTLPTRPPQLARGPDLTGMGPTYDGRTKPEVIAPGVPVTSARSQAPTGPQCDLLTRAGTSMATPLAAGQQSLNDGHQLKPTKPNHPTTPSTVSRNPHSQTQLGFEVRLSLASGNPASFPPFGVITWTLDHRACVHAPLHSTLEDSNAFYCWSNVLKLELPLAFTRAAF